MLVVRICKAKHPELDGEGAKIKGGRWNSAGTPIVYTSSCAALAALEYRVNTSENPKDLLIYTLEIPDTVQIEKTDWMPDARTSRELGDVWINSKRTAILAVPSVVVPRQINYLLNPRHPDAGAIRVVHQQPYVLDLRLFDLLQ
jgi:RES domain-containing protein